MSHSKFGVAIHGGAGVNPGQDYQIVERDLELLINACCNRLAQGAGALDVVEWVIGEMEASGFYCAGRGSGPNTDGIYELDASIMDGALRRAGGVCAVRDVVSPIAAARLVMEQTPHVLLAGEGANAFCKRQGLAHVTDPSAYYVTPIGVLDSEIATAGQTLRTHGTVGAVALDLAGNLAAGTSTGGTFGKLPGRIGDTPIAGLGTWADKKVAISCTGIGETFILSGGAGNVAARVLYGQATIQSACNDMIADVGDLGGDGGVIAIDSDGQVSFSFNSPGMKRACAGSDCPTMIAVF
jgi:L-asparaginase / beta-aspartyl-peptidase